MLDINPQEGRIRSDNVGRCQRSRDGSFEDEGRNEDTFVEWLAIRDEALVIVEAKEFWRNI